MQEQLLRLKRRLSLTDSCKDELLTDLLMDADSFVRAYTGRQAIPGTLSGVLVELAAGAYHRLGLEGQSAYSEGGVSVSLDALPKPIRDLLGMYRLGKVGG